MPEEENDFKSVEWMTREAFWDVYKPGCDEHLIVHKIKKVPAFVVANKEKRNLNFCVWDQLQYCHHIKNKGSVLY